MKFYTETITGDLILIKTNISTVPPCPVIARSIPTVDAAIIRLVLWLIARFAPIVGPLSALWIMNKVRFAVLVIVALAIIEVVAQAQLTKALGGIIA